MLATSREEVLTSSDDWGRALADSLPVLIWRSGPDGLCTYFNDRWLQFTGRTLQESLGDGWARDLHPDDHDRVIRDYYHFLQARQKLRLEYRLRYRSGPYRWIVDFGSPVFNQDRTFLRYIGGCIDVALLKLRRTPAIGSSMIYTWARG